MISLAQALALAARVLRVLLVLALRHLGAALRHA